MSGYGARRLEKVVTTGRVFAPKPRSTSSPAAPNKKMTGTGVPIVMPNQDLTVTEATVVRWLKRIGDAVKLGETIVEVETEKAIVAVESPASGILVTIHAGEKAVVAITESLGAIQPG